jgi:uncharacterized integral membrane protein
MRPHEKGDYIMPWRLIVFIVLFLVFFLFIVFNLENKTDISFGFTRLPDIPVFVTAFFSFIAGMFCTFPFIFRPRKKPGEAKGKGLLAKAAKKQGDSGLTDKNHYGID